MSTSSQGGDNILWPPGTTPVGTAATTRARLTLLDAGPDANETSHGRSLPVGEVLAVHSSVSQSFL
jgi:hypothetical protein